MPVDAKELRIGNWVEYPLIGKQKIESGADIDMAHDNAAQPIPISSDILEASKWLVEDKENSTCYSYDGFKVWAVDNEGVKQWYHLNSETLTFFDYIHQIQNYFYAITEGEEVNIIFP